MRGNKDAEKTFSSLTIRVKGKDYQIKPYTKKFSKKPRRKMTSLQIKASSVHDLEDRINIERIIKYHKYILAQISRVKLDKFL